MMKRLIIAVSIVAVSTVGCDVCHDIPGGRRWVKNAGSSCNLSDRAIGALVIANSETITGIVINRNGLAVPSDSSVSVTHQNLLSTEFQNRGLYNPVSESIFYFRTTNSETCTDSDTGFIDILIDGGSPGTGRLVGGATTETDLNDGAPLTSFEFVNDDLSNDPFTTRPISQVPIGGPSLYVVLTLLIFGSTAVAIRRRRHTFMVV